ncbi:uncharacterized protein V6R79_004634 [Siganus canaliculatus]
MLDYRLDWSHAAKNTAPQVKHEGQSEESATGHVTRWIWRQPLYSLGLADGSWQQQPLPLSALSGELKSESCSRTETFRQQQECSSDHSESDSDRDDSAADMTLFSLHNLLAKAIRLTMLQSAQLPLTSLELLSQQIQHLAQLLQQLGSPDSSLQHRDPTEPKLLQPPQPEPELPPQPPQPEPELPPQPPQPEPELPPQPPQPEPELPPQPPQPEPELPPQPPQPEPELPPQPPQPEPALPPQPPQPEPALPPQPPQPEPALPPQPPQPEPALPPQPPQPEPVLPPQPPQPERESELQSCPQPRPEALQPFKYLSCTPEQQLSTLALLVRPEVGISDKEERQDHSSTQKLDLDGCWMSQLLHFISADRHISCQDAGETHSKYLSAAVIGYETEQRICKRAKKHSPNSLTAASSDKGMKSDESGK